MNSIRAFALAFAATLACAAFAVPASALESETELIAICGDSGFASAFDHRAPCVGQAFELSEAVDLSAALTPAECVVTHDLGYVPKVAALTSGSFTRYAACRVPIASTAPA